MQKSRVDNLNNRSAALPPQTNPDEMSMGKYGGIAISDTNVHTGPFCAIQAYVDSTFDAGTEHKDITGSMTGWIIKAGAVAVGKFEKVQFSGSPKVVAFYGHRQ